MAEVSARAAADKERLGRAFRFYREAAGITLRAMSRKMGMSINTIRMHEAGARIMRVEDVWRAAKILGVTNDRLLDPKLDPTE